MKKLLLLILVTLSFASYTAAIAGRYNPPPATFPTSITGPVASGGTVNSLPIPITITLDRTASPALTINNFTVQNGTISNLAEKVVLSYLSQIGTSGTGNGNLTQPNDIALGADGKRYVTDGVNNRVEVFSADGSYAAQIGSAGTGDGQFSAPYGIAVDAANNVYVADANNNRVEIFNNLGTYTGSIGTSGSGLLNAPQGIYIDPATNRLYVADSGNNRIAIFDLNNGGAYLTQMGSAGSGSGQFFGPSGVVVTGGFVYVTDSGNKRIVKFDASGNGVGTIGSSGNTDGKFLSPAGITTDGTGKIYVTDKSTKPRVQIFSTGGAFLGTAGTVGTGNGNLNFPSGIAADQSGKIYVADRNNNRVEVFAAKEQYTASLVPTGNGPETVTVSLATAVSDINGEGNAPATYSIVYTATPANPANLVATSLDGSYQLNWDPNSAGDNVVGYNIYEGTSANNLTLLTSVDQSTTTYTSDIPVTNGTTLFFYVTAVTVSKESGPSNIVQVTPKGNPSINAGTLPNKTYGDAAFDIAPLLHPSSASGGAFTYSLDPSSTGATLNGTTITITGVGHVIVVINQAATNTYNAAVLNVPFDINIANQTITATQLPDKTYGDAPFDVVAALNATASSGLPISSYTLLPTSAGATLSGNTLTITGTGTVKIAIKQDGNSNYNPAELDVQFNVDLANQTITANTLPDKTFGDAPFDVVAALNASASSGLPISSYTLLPTSTGATLAGNMLTITGTGTVKIAIKQDGDSNYNPTELDVQFNVGLANQTITANTLPDKTYGDAPFDVVAALNAIASSGLPISSYTLLPTSTGATLSGSTLTITGSGTVKIAIKQDGDSNYNPTELDVQFNVNLANQTITANTLPDKAVGDAAFNVVTALNASASSGLPISSYTLLPGSTGAILSGQMLTITGVGTVKIAIKQDGNSNYNPAELDVQFNVGIGSQTITANILPDKTVGDAAFNVVTALNASASSGLPISSYTLLPGSTGATLSGQTLTITGVGTVKIAIKQDGNSDYNPAELDIQFNVGIGNQTITANTLPDKAVGDAAFNVVTALNASASSGLPISSYTLLPGSTGATLNGQTLTITGVGTVKIAIKQDGNSNYNPAELDVQFNVGIGNQTITANTLPDKTFGDAPFNIVAALNASASSGLPISSYTLLPGSTGATLSGQTLTITGTGTVKIAIKQDGDANYNPAELDVQFNVGAASQTITASTIGDKIVGDPAFDIVAALNASSSSGLPISSYTLLPSSTGATLSGNTLTITGTGTVKIAIKQDGNSTYSPAELDVQFNINPAPVNPISQTITASTIGDKIVGDPAFDIVAALNASSSSGLPISSYTLLPSSTGATLSGNTLTITGTGTVKIAIKQDGNSTYSPAELNVQFNINPAPVNPISQTITASTIGDKIVGDPAFDIVAALNASSSSGLPISSYTLLPSSTGATLSGNTLTITGTGTVKIAIKQDGNSTYSPAELDVQFNINPAPVNPISQTITASTIGDKIVGDPAFDIVAALNASSSSGLPISSYTLLPSSTGATLNGNTLTITGTGTVKIAIKQDGNSTYSPAELDVQFNINPAPVNPISQTITASTIGDKIVGDPAFDIVAALNASSSSGLPISSYTLLPSSTGATLSGNTLTITGTGTVKIAIKQDGNSTYSPAELDVQFNINPTPVNPISQTITASTIGDKIVGDPAFDIVAALNASSSSGLPISSYTLLPSSTGATLSGNTLTITGTGTVKIAIKQDGNSTYSPAELDVQFNINPAPVNPISQTITASTIGDKIVGDPAFDIVAALNAQTSSGLPISSYTLLPSSTGATLSGNTLTITGTGTVKIAIKQDGNSTYSPAELDVQFNINPAPVNPISQTITASTIGDKIVGDPAFDVVAALNASSSSGLPISSYTLLPSSTGATLSGNTLTITGTGTVKIAIKQDGNSTYSPAELDVQFNINPAPVNPISQTITASTIGDKIVGDPAFDIVAALNASSSSGLPISSYTLLPSSTGATLSGNTLTITGTGTVKIAIKQDGNSTYSPAELDVQFNINPAPVNPISQTITASTIGDKIVGDPAFDIVAALNAQTSSGLPISSYTLLPSSTGATLSGNTLIITGTGTVKIAIKQDGNSTYSPAELDVQFNINPAPVNPISQTITASTIGDKIVGDPAFDIVAALNASSSSGLPISSYTLLPSSTGATLSGNTLTITGTGTVKIAIKQDGNSTYSPAELDVQFNINPAPVNPISQTITASTIGDKIVGDPAFDIVAALNASSSSGLPISSYTLLPSSTGATLSGNTLTITGTGTVKIAIKQDGNSTYGPAELDVQFNINPAPVNPISQTITASTIGDKIVGDPAFDIVAALNASSSSGLPISSYTLLPSSIGATLSGNTLTITGTGTVKIAIRQDGNSTYSPAELDVQFNINPAPVNPISQTITASTIGDKIVGDPAFDIVAALNASSSSGLPISSYTLLPSSTGATLSGNTLTITGTGTVKIAIKQDGNSTYSPAELDVQFNINPAPVNPISQTITASTIGDKIVGDPAFDIVAALNAQTSSGLPISSYTLLPSSTGAILSGNTLTITGTGTVKIAIKQDGNSTYSPAELDVQFNINPANNPTNPAVQTITANTIPAKTIGDAPFDVVAALNAQASSGLPISSYTLLPGSTGATLSGNTLTITGIGTVKIAIKQDGNSSYSPAELDVQFNVGKADQTITIAGVIPDKAVNAPVFDIAAIPVTATASSGLPVSYSIVSGPATISGTRITLTGGNGVVTVAFNQAGNVNYNAAPQATLTFNVNKLSQTIAVTGSIPDKTYGDAPFNWRTIPVTATASSGLPVVAAIASGPATINGNIITITGAGEVTVLFSQAGNTVYDAAADQTLTFKVNQITPQVTWVTPTSITYGTALSSQQLYASSATPGTFTYSPAAGTVLHAGTQTLSVTFTPTDAVNYSTYTKTVSLVVTKVPVNVSVNNASRPYNQPNPDFVINYSGFVNGDTPANLITQATASSTATPASLVGTYPITVGGAVSDDYTFRYVNATLTVTTTGRDLTFNQLPVKTYGDPDFDAGAVATSGEPIIYTSSNTAVATVVNGLIHIVGAGYVTITASLPVNSNYNTTPSISQFMLVNKAAQTIDFANIPVQLRGTTYDLSNIKSSSGLPVTFTTNDPMIASINGLTVSSLRVGVTGIVANQAGDANYYPANTVVRNLEVKDANREVIVHPAVSPNGDGINDILYIEGITEHPANRVTIINRNGVRVYEINGYDNATKSFDGRSNFTGAKQQAGTYFYLVEYMVDGVGRHLTGYFVLKYD